MLSSLIEVPDLGSIGAGSVVEFIPRGKKLIIQPPGTNEKDYIFTHDVAGDSLYNPDNPHFSAFNGDTLICKGIYDLSEVKPSKVCIVFVQSTCERLAKKIVIKDQWCYLTSLNPSYPPRRYPLDVIEIKGIVLGVQRHW